MTRLRMTFSLVLLAASLVATSVCADELSDRAQHVVEQLDKVRDHKSSRLDSAHIDTAHNIAALDALALAADVEAQLDGVVGCIASCEVLLDGLAAQGVVILLDHFTLGFDETGALFYTIGATHGRDAAWLRIDRETNRLMAVGWVARDGRPVEVAVTGYTNKGWRPHLLQVTAGTDAVELTFDPTAERAEVRP